MLKAEWNAAKTIFTITIDRPPVNAWTEEGYKELSALLQEAENTPSACSIILQANGRMFSAGADVKRLAKDGPKEGAIRRPILRQACFDLIDSPLVVVAAIHGRAVGVGAAMAAASDIILATEDASFSIPEINVGVVGAGAAMRRLVPEHAVRYAAFTGDQIDASLAATFGSVRLVKNQDILKTEALNLAEQIAKKGSLAIRKWKESLNITETLDGRSALLVEQCLGQELSLLSTKPKIHN